MPTYQYACTNPDCGERFELVQSFTDPAASQCPVCGGPVRKVFSAVGVVFKGSGFYRTDNRPKESSGSGSSDSSSGSAKGGKSDAKSSAASGSSGSDSSGSGSSGSGSSGSGSMRARTSTPSASSPTLPAT